MSTYTPVGHALELFKSREKFVAIVGPARCGKSRAALEKTLLFGMKHPGARILFTRKVRASMTESILETFESYVAPKGSPWVDNVTRGSRTKYVLPNGTEIIIAGMDMPSKILSSEYDYIYAGEACELEEEDYEVLSSRLSGRNAPYRQFVLDSNPGAPTHWLKRRIDNRDLHLIQFDFSDNPSLDKDVIDTLSKLTGHRRKRLFEGFWSAAKGVVFDLSKCTIDEDEIPAGEVYGGHDFGWSAPAANVVGVVYKDQFGRDVLYVYAAEQASGVPAEVQAQKMLTMGGTECIWFADPSNPEGIRELGKHGLRVFEATNAILFGIDAVNSLIEGERLFVSSKLRELLDVTAGYAYGDDGIKPVKENDHLCFAAGQLVDTPIGPKAIETLRVGDTVLAHDGLATVVKAGETGIHKVYQLTLEDGRAILCTGEHPIRTSEGWCPAKDALGKEALVCPTDQRRLSSTVVTGGSATPTQAPMAASTSDGRSTKVGAQSFCTAGSGSTISVLSLLDATFTTGMETRGTTNPRILSASESRPTRSGIRSLEPRFSSSGATCAGSPIWPLPGTEAQPVDAGTLGRPSRHSVCESQRSGSVCTVARTTRPPADAPVSVQVTARWQPEELQASIRNQELAPCVESSSLSTAICRRSTVPEGALRLRVSSVEGLPERPVYNLSTTSGTYLVNGVVVSNCDALRYLVASLLAKNLMEVGAYATAA